MSRSVYVPGDAACVAYCALDNSWYENDDGGWMEDIAESVMQALPSLKSARGWIDREGCVVAENKFCRLVIAEYCGLVSVSLVPNGSGIAYSWAEKQKAKLIRACDGVGTALYSKGYASNGEQFLEAYSHEQKGAMGLGYTSKEGWL